MKTNVTRRDVLRLAGGAAAGVALSPVPWKLTDDLAIWTQNWGWIPTPPKGEETTRRSVCSLCPAGCAVRARCVGGQPVSLHGVAADPVSGGALCALGITAHHLSYHPARVTAPVRSLGKEGMRRRFPVQLDAVVAETARALASAAAGSSAVAVLDMRPGRSGSWAWRRLLAGFPGSVVIAAPGLAGASLATLERMAPGGSGPIGFDLDAARIVVSFGAPLAEGWGAPASAARLLGRGRGGPRLVQVEPVRSRTAELADSWLAVRPGTEAALALGLAHVILAERLLDPGVAERARDLATFAEIAGRFTPEAAAAATGVPAGRIVATARELGALAPALVLAGENAGGGRLGRVAETAVWALDLLLGSLGGRGTLVRRRELPAPTIEGALAPMRELDELADHSIAVLVVDASAGEAAFPWPLVERKLVRTGGTVVALSPFRSGVAGRADFIVPTAPFPEAYQELPTGFDAPRAAFAVSAPLLPARPGSVDPVSFVREIAGVLGRPLGSWGSIEDLGRARCARIHRDGRGSVVAGADGSVSRVSDLPTPEALWKALAAGGRWQDEPVPPAPETGVTLLGDVARELVGVAASGGGAGSGDARRPLILVPRGRRDVTASGAVSPIVAKLYRESSLRRAPGTAVVNPGTARTLGLSAGRRWRLETAGGAATVRVETDPGVMPGVVEVGVAPSAAALGDRGPVGAASVLDLCGADESAGWRREPARLVEA